MTRKLPQARGIFCLDDPKFDALVGSESWVHQKIVEEVDKIVDICLENSYLEQSSVEVYKIPDILLYNPQKSLPFKNSLHERYSQLNKLEKEFVQELDKFSAKWCRNPSRSGYAIPLITRGDTQIFILIFWFGTKTILLLLILV